MNIEIRKNQNHCSTYILWITVYAQSVFVALFFPKAFFFVVHKIFLFNTNLCSVNVIHINRTFNFCVLGQDYVNILYHHKLLHEKKNITLMTFLWIVWLLNEINIITIQSTCSWQNNSTPWKWPAPSIRKSIRFGVTVKQLLRDLILQFLSSFICREIY